MSSVFSNSQNRQERLKAYVAEDKILSVRTYNLIMGLVVLYGLIVNFILCLMIDLEVIMYINPIVMIIVYVVCSIAGCVISRKSNNAFISFLGYNLVVVPLGVLVAVLVNVYAAIDTSIVTGAVYYTLLITAIMVLAASLFPKFFARIGGILLVALIGLAFAGLIMMLFGLYPGWYSYVAAAIFSLYIGFDFYRSQQFPPTADNAVDCALDIYMDIISLFIRLLEIFARSDD